MRSLLSSQFQTEVYEYYDHHGRHTLPWRISEVDGSFDPYKILVSELMLQQTQVARVIPKYQDFIATLPTVNSLATAELGDVLRLWSGLGYNRRAKYLFKAAGQIMEAGGQFPDSEDALVTLAGVGHNTAGAILAYAYNQPVIFVETNIRTVYIHHFFRDDEQISDLAITELVKRTIDADNPRQWYWALMDYGSFLKRTVGNLNRLSSSYIKQSKFEGSNRQLRGKIIGALKDGPLALDELQQRIDDDRLSAIVDQLVAEGLIKRTAKSLRL